MKYSVFLLTFIALALFSYSALAIESPKTGQTIPVSVTAFTNKASGSGIGGTGCHGWSWFGTDLGDAFADIMVENLQKNPKVAVFERENIDEIYENEVDLVNSNDQSIKRGNFKKAKITFVGVVDNFEFCEGGSGVAVNVGRLFGVGDIIPAVKISKATVSVLVRAIETSTGKVLASARSKKEQKKSSLGLVVGVDGFNFAAADFKQSAIGESMQAAISDVTEQLMEKIKI